MHLVPPERAHRRAIDEHAVCDAIEGIGDADQLETWAQRLALLGEPRRLAVLLAVHHAGPIAVTDLATATGFNDAAVSQILRLLRVSGAVSAGKDGRVVRYRIADDDVARLLDLLREPVALGPAAGTG